MYNDGEVNETLIKNCQIVGLKQDGTTGFFIKGEHRFDLSASGYEFKDIAYNIIKQL